VLGKVALSLGGVPLEFIIAHNIRFTRSLINCPQTRIMSRSGAAGFSRCLPAPARTQIYSANDTHWRKR
jgi:hypothetical protein